MILSECLLAKNADHCMLVNEWAPSKSPVCLLWLKVNLGSVLFWNQMKYGAVNASIIIMLKVVSSERFILKRDITCYLGNI